MFISFITRTCLLLAVLESATTQNDQGSKTCKISDDIEGECILLQKCPRALDLLKLNDIKSLRNLTCGYDKLDAKVCCVTNKTDGISITFNTTKDTATSRPEGSISVTVKVPPDPVATFPPSTPPTEAHTSKVVYSTTFVPSTTHKQKKTNAPHHNNEFNVPTLPSSSAFAFRPPTPPTRPPSNLQSQEVPSMLEIASETIPTFDNPLGIDTNIPARFPLEEPDNSKVGSWLSEGSDGVTEQMDRFPVLQHAVNLPSRNECGLLSTTDRIFGGQVAGLEELPWLARIKYLLRSKEIYACHASLITDRFLITAAHCVVDQQIIDVRLGDWDAETEIDCIQEDCNDPPVDVKVDAKFIHPSYHRQTLVGDIALLRLAHPVNFTEFIRPVCLPTTEYIARIDYDPDSEYLTGGWGKTEFETRSAIKRKIRLTAVPIPTCRAAIRRMSDQLAASSICAGGRKGEDSCSGDSGSSLVRLASENRRFNWFLFGVTSFGSSKCGSEGIPGIYSRVTYYMDWILSILAL
ncbi:CLIP domain-containing serine protease HP8-like [Cydia pomonella]|uniref:CLIP domain-containing serine protease HP8-like n=1 Tax=Cydia pomonella TaxID=82600 RepID=UPI002ADD3EDD|nr:CLIP domain-containing serine protease HP8-like [Cydia pomonella]